MTKTYFGFRFIVGLLAAVLILLLASQVAVADNIYATIRGTTTDSTGAVLAGVSVTATNAQTGVSTTTTSGSSGLYEFLQLPVGSYTVTATKQGFKTFKSTAFPLAVNQIYGLPINMQLGSLEETVEVKAQAVQVETTSIQHQSVVTSQQIVDLPLIGRNFTQLEQLSPGVMSGSDRFGSGANGTAFSINGAQTQQSSFLIDGTDSNDIPLNTSLFLPSPDALQEFNLISSTINPEYGRNSGGIVNALIKNGTNSIHGDVFDFYRDTFLNNRNFFTVGPNSPIFHQNVFGGTVGGPIWKDKTFFFLSYQGIRNRTSTSSVVSVLSPQERAGNFSADVASIANGTNGNTTPFDNIVGDDGQKHPAGTPWFGNSGAIFNCGTPTVVNKKITACSNPNFGILGSGNFNPISVNLMNTFVPSPNAASNQFGFNPINTSKADQGIARIDHNLTRSDLLWGTMIFNHNPTTQTLPFTGATLPGFGETDKREGKEFTVAWSHTFSNTMLNEVRLGYARFNFDAVEPAKPALPSSFGFTGITPQNTTGAGMPVIVLTGLFTLGFSDNGPQPRKDQNYQFTDNFSRIMGRHSLKFGFDARRFQVDNPFFGQNDGHFDFGTGNGSFGTNSPAVDFLLGIPDAYSQGAGGVINARAYEYYGYGQDQWKIKDNLTLTFGAGYQVDTPYNNNQFGGEAFNCFQPNVQSNVFPTAPLGLTFPGDPGCTKSGTTIHWGHIGPRVGFAWSPSLGKLSGGTGKFSVRGGFGIYFNRTEEEGALQNLGAPPFGISSNGAADKGGSPQFANPFADITGSAGNSEANKFPFTAFPKPGDTNIRWDLQEPFVINVISPNFTTPYAMNFNLSIQRELPANTVLTLGYVGSKGVHLYRSYEGDFITAAGQAACLTEVTMFQGNQVSCASSLGRTIQAQAFPQNTIFPNAQQGAFQSVGVQATDGTSNYNALQANVTKGMTHGLQIITSYTWSHSIDNGSGLENSGFGARGINLINPALNIGDSGFDARQRLVLGYVYAVPSLHQLASWAPDRIFGGWKMSGITTFQTGFPFNLSDSSQSSLACNGTSFFACPNNPNQVAASVTTLNPRTSSFNGKGDYWFDPSSFAAVPLCTFKSGVLQNGNVCGQFGDTRRNALHGPGINNTDFALLKDTKITERTNLEVGLEAYNVFNHTQFCNANTCFTTNIRSANFGRITGNNAAANGRLVQIRAKFYF
jgi:hypothetical protein